MITLTLAIEQVEQFISSFLHTFYFKNCLNRLLENLQ